MTQNAVRHSYAHAAATNSSCVSCIHMFVSLLLHFIYKSAHLSFSALITHAGMANFDVCLQNVLPFLLHHPIQWSFPVAANLTAPKPWPYISGPVVAMWNRWLDPRQYWSATSCGSGAARGPRICQFGGCRNACWQAKELTSVSIATFASVKQQAKSEKARRSTAVKEQARKRRRTHA